MKDSFPRLLVATEFPPNASGGGPAVVRQALKDWPADNLYWWSCFPDRDAKFSQKVAAHQVAAIPPRLYPQRRLCLLRSWLMEQAWSRWAAWHLKKTLLTIRPDVIWLIPHAWSILPLHTVLPGTNIPFHVSAHDYPDIRGGIARFGLGRCRRMATMMDDLYIKAISRDAICRPMVADLQARTGCDGNVFHAGIEQEEIEYVAGKTETRLDKIRIAYAGTIIVEEAFEFFVTALGQIRRQFPMPVWLDFFNEQSYRSREWFDAAWMREHGHLATAELARALRDCTWGLTAMSLADDDPRYNRFSFPTKSVTYLRAGLPILALGHPESSLIKMAGTYKIGLCTSTNNGDQLQRQLLAELAEPQPFLKYKSEILRCISAEYEMPRLRKALYDNLFACAQAGKSGGSG